MGGFGSSCYGGLARVRQPQFAAGLTNAMPSRSSALHLSPSGNTGRLVHGRPVLSLISSIYINMKARHLAFAFYWPVVAWRAFYRSGNQSAANRILRRNGGTPGDAQENSKESFFGRC